MCKKDIEQIGNVKKKIINFYYFFYTYNLKEINVRDLLFRAQTHLQKF